MHDHPPIEEPEVEPRRVVDFPILAAFAPDGSPIVEFELKHEGLYTFGNGVEATFQLEDPQLEMKHIEFLLGEDGLLMQARGETQVGAFTVTKPLALADGDVIKAGQITLELFAPLTAPYPRARIDDALWSVRPGNEDWDASSGVALFRPIKDTPMIENLALTMDDLSAHKSLDAYIDTQTYRILQMVPDFRWEAEPAEPIWGFDELKIVLGSMTFQDTPKLLLQAYGAFGPFVGIAAWTVPAGVGSRDEGFQTFKGYLEDLVRFH